MIRIISIITIALVISACETTRQTKTNNIGASTTKKLEASFDKQKAAAQRVSTGLTYLNRSNYTRAKFHLDRALEYDPDSGDVHYGLGIYFQKVKEYDKAEKHFKESLDIDRRNARYMNAYASYLCEKGEFEKADKMFHRAIDVPTYSEVAFAFYNVGFCALKQDKEEKAEEYFRKALNRDRNMSGALIEMAKLEFKKDRYARTMSYLRRYETSSRVSAESAWLALRAAHFLRDKDSIAKYSTILEQRFPDSEETAEFLDEKKRWM